MAGGPLLVKTEEAPEMDGKLERHRVTMAVRPVLLLQRKHSKSF
jgi:hypothetical protein